MSQAQGDETRFGNQDTDGSRSLRHFFEPMRSLRRCRARRCWKQAAAARWGVERRHGHSACNHEVVHQASGRELGYGELAERGRSLPVPARSQLQLKDPGAVSLHRQGRASQYRRRASTSTTGRARYGIDTGMPGMLCRGRRVVRRCTAARSRAFDATEAHEGRRAWCAYCEIPGTPPPSEFDPVGGVAVVARNTWAAMQGPQRARRSTWDDGPERAYVLVGRLQGDAAKRHVRKPGRGGAQRTATSPQRCTALRSAIAAEYYVPHIAHATMEPPAAAARSRRRQVRSVGAACRAPQAARDRVAKNLGIPLESVDRAS